MKIEDWEKLQQDSLRPGSLGRYNSVQRGHWVEINICRGCGTRGFNSDYCWTEPCFRCGSKTYSKELSGRWRTIKVKLKNPVNRGGLLGLLGFTTTFKAFTFWQLKKEVEYHEPS